MRLGLRQINWSSNREQPREIKKKKRCYSNALNFLLHGQKEGLVHFFADRAPQGQQQVLSGEKFHYKDNEFYHLLYFIWYPERSLNHLYSYTNFYSTS
jgi:hypothetical protein